MSLIDEGKVASVLLEEVAAVAVQWVEAIDRRAES